MSDTVLLNKVNEADRSLYLRIRSGDIGALDPLIERHAGRVQVIIRRIIEGYGDEKDVEDLAQEVCLKVWDRIDTYDPTRSFATWINSLAKYTALDFRREFAKTDRLLQSLAKTHRMFVEDPVTELFAKMERKEQKRIFKAALKELSSDKAQYIDWHYLKGMTCREIAEMVGSPVGTVKSRVSRAVQELKLCIYLNS